MAHLWSMRIEWGTPMSCGKREARQSDSKQLKGKIEECANIVFYRAERRLGISTLAKRQKGKRKKCTASSVYMT
eukprot:1160769-Pelagomonas_calceolata.AAC.14